MTQIPPTAVAATMGACLAFVTKPRAAAQDTAIRMAVGAIASVALYAVAINYGSKAVMGAIATIIFTQALNYSNASDRCIALFASIGAGGVLGSLLLK